MNRILGLDAGERRIGVAISDPDRSFALPLRSIIVDGSEIAALKALANEEDVEAVVVGLPLSLSGEASAQTERARAFAQRLEAALALPVHLWDERLSTREALGRAPTPGGSRRRGGGRHEAGPDTDAIAASIILQAYLDRLRFSQA